MKIKFTPILGVSELFPPSPISKHIPDWYKKTKSYSTEKDRPSSYGDANGTVKKCIPFFDAMTAGYLLVTQHDIHVEQKEHGPYYSWNSVQEGIRFHPVEQNPNYPDNKYPFAKLINPYSISTPKGYSVLIVPPMHFDTPIKILEGIVDTDTFNGEINFPFVLKDPTFSGLISAGTPVAQIIPFKRENWEMEIQKSDFELKYKSELKIKTYFQNNYKRLFWNKKEYR